MSILKNAEDSEVTAVNDVKKSCFIITPIGELNSEINLKAFGLIKSVVQPVLENFGYLPIASSDLSSPGSINKQIIIRLYDDELVIANLTGLNPNVMYELAVRHAVRKPIIMMAEKGTKLPFDLYDQRCVFYHDSLHGVELAKEELANFISSALKEKTVNNPIYDSLKEEQILKQLSATDDPNKYILTRLDRLDTLLSNITEKTSYNSAQTTYPYVRFELKDDVDLDVVKKIIENECGFLVESDQFTIVQDSKGQHSLKVNRIGEATAGYIAKILKRKSVLKLK